MTAPRDDRLARVALSFVADPGDEALGALLGVIDPVEMLAVLSGPGDPWLAMAAAGSPQCRERWANSTLPRTY